MSDGDTMILKLKDILIEHGVGWEQTRLVAALHSLCASYGYPVPVLPRKKL